MATNNEQRSTNNVLCEFQGGGGEAASIWYLVFGIWNAFGFWDSEARGPSGPSSGGKGAKFKKVRKGLMEAGLVQGGQEGRVVFGRLWPPAFSIWYSAFEVLLVCSRCNLPWMSKMF